jgi:hypothetical protein
MMLSSILTPVDALPSSFAVYVIYRSGTPIVDPDAKCIWRIVGSGVTTSPRHSKNVNIIVTALEEAGVAVESASSGSPANASAYMITARFLDGGLSGVTGNYFLYEGNSLPRSAAPRRGRSRPARSKRRGQWLGFSALRPTHYPPDPDFSVWNAVLTASRTPRWFRTKSG